MMRFDPNKHRFVSRNGEQDDYMRDGAVASEKATVEFAPENSIRDPTGSVPFEASMPIASTVQEWEIKIMDRVSRMTISTEMSPKEESSATEVSFTEDDLAELPSTAQETVLLTPLKSSPVRKRSKRKTANSTPLNNQPHSFVTTPIRPPCGGGGGETDMRTPQISNLHPRRTKKARSIDSSSPLPHYLRQPCFSPCTSVYDQHLARIAMQESKSSSLVVQEEDTPPLSNTASSTNLFNDALSASVSPICASNELQINWMNPGPKSTFTLRRRKRMLRMRNQSRSCAPFPLFHLPPKLSSLGCLARSMESASPALPEL